MTRLSSSLLWLTPEKEDQSLLHVPNINAPERGEKIKQVVRLPFCADVAAGICGILGPGAVDKMTKR